MSSAEDTFMTEAPEGFVLRDAAEIEWETRQNEILAAYGIFPNHPVWHICNSPSIEQTLATVWQPGFMQPPGVNAEMAGVNAAMASVNAEMNREAAVDVEPPATRSVEEDVESVAPRSKTIPRMVPPPAKAAPVVAKDGRTGLSKNGRVSFPFHLAAKAKPPSRVVYQDQQVFVPTQLLRRR